MLTQKAYMHEFDSCKHGMSNLLSGTVITHLVSNFVLKKVNSEQSISWSTQVKMINRQKLRLTYSDCIYHA